MSNLHIRVMTGFFSHRKTIRLRSLIGNDAYWLPIRLWAYAAENQPDGNISSYSDSELETLLGFSCASSNASSNATSIKQVLMDSGFIDSQGLIHDWKDYNSYHLMYSERAKNAARARWDRVAEKKEKKQKKVNKDIEKEKEASIASSIAQACSKHNWLSSKEFYNSFLAWNRYRKEIKHALSRSTIDKQIEFLGSLGSAEAAIASINQSIEKGWQGLFSVNGKTNGQQTFAALSPAQATYQHQEELKRVEASIASVKNNASADALGPIYSADEKKKLSELRARRSQLCDLLGFPK